jgi:hypothetical protein
MFIACLCHGGRSVHGNMSATSTSCSATIDVDVLHARGIIAFRPHRQVGGTCSAVALTHAHEIFLGGEVSLDPMDVYPASRSCEDGAFVEQCARLCATRGQRVVVRPSRRGRVLATVRDRVTAY